MDKHTPPNLSQYSTFADLPPAGLAYLQAGLRRIELEAGEEIIRPGEFGDFLGIVTDGELALETERGARQRVREGGVFGEGMLRYGVPSSFRGLAATETVIWLITRPEFLAAQAIGMEMPQKSRVPDEFEQNLESGEPGNNNNKDTKQQRHEENLELNPEVQESGEAKKTDGSPKSAGRRGRHWLRWGFIVGILALAWVILGPLLLPAINRSVVDLLLKSGNPQGAESYLQLAFQLQPDTADLFDGLGTVMYTQGRVEEAINQLKQAVELDPELASARNNLAVALMTSGRAGAAVPHLEKAVELDPGNALLYYNLGNAYLQSDQLAEAEQAYRRAMEFEPENQTTRARWAGAAAAFGEIQEARDVWEAILSGAPGEIMAVALSYQGLGMLEYQQGNPSQALVYLESARAANPADPLTYLYLGMALEKLDLPGEAIAAYRQALSLSPVGSEAARQAGEQLERLQTTAAQTQAETPQTAAPQADPASAPANQPGGDSGKP